MDYEQITVEVHKRVAVIRLDRPDKLNAWTFVMHDELVHAIQEINDNPELGVIVLTGNGRGFCAGVDFVNASLRKGARGAKTRRPTENWSTLLHRSKPVVAAINGVALGIGATLSLSADLIMIADTAEMGFIFVKMGLVPELASSRLLVQRVGLGKAKEMCLTGRTYPAEELLACGLVDYIVPARDLVERALKLASEIAANPSPQLRMTKRLLADNSCCDDLDLIERREIEMNKQAVATPEHQAVLKRFFERSRKR